jgi:2-oxoglutarate dehydrogenase E2 component (dihydrolipoamide succinyltransferase)
MATQIVIPNVGESVTSGVIASWSVKDGDWVERDQTVLELETDKVTMEVPAPAAGVIRHGAKAGDEVAVGASVGTIDESAAKPAGGNGAATKPEPAATKAADPKPAPKAESKPAAAPAAVAEAPRPAAGHGGGDHKATPLARKLAEDNHVDLGSISGTGAGGRIREQDVLAFIQTHQNGSGPAAAAPAPAAATSRGTRREKMTPIRQRIAQRLVEAQHTAAMLTTFNEVDMTNIMKLRAKYKEGFEKKHGIGLGFMSFFVKAAANALMEFPTVNAYLVKDAEGQPAVQKHAYADIAIAVSTPKGLVVPVLRNAERMSFATIESSIKEVATRARDGKLTLEDMQGGTFTITNGGVFGSLMSTPILNAPQSAILGMHATKNRAVEDPEKPGQVAIRPMMYLALSYDHRMVDGARRCSSWCRSRTRSRTRPG